MYWQRTTHSLIIFSYELNYIHILFAFIEKATYHFHNNPVPVASSYSLLYFITLSIKMFCEYFPTQQKNIYFSWMNKVQRILISFFNNEKKWHFYLKCAIDRPRFVQKIVKTTLVMQSNFLNFEDGFARMRLKSSNPTTLIQIPKHSP